MSDYEVTLVNDNSMQNPLLKFLLAHSIPSFGLLTFCCSVRNIPRSANRKPRIDLTP